MEMIRIGGETRTKVETLINFIVNSYSRLTNASVDQNSRFVGVPALVGFKA